MATGILVVAVYLDQCHVVEAGLNASVGINL
jgi:hypothetical protein